MRVRLRAAGALLLAHHLVIGGQARLAFGLPRLGVGAHPLQLLGHGALAGLGLAVLLHDPLGLLLQPAGVVALEGDALAAVQLQRPLGDLVQEIAVVGDQDHAAGEGLQVVLQPGDALGVQVVGGLVQQQHVGLAEQQAGQSHAALLPAGELVHRPFGRGAAQGVHGLLDAGVDVPQILRVDLLLKGVHLLHQLVGVVLGHLHGDGVVAVEDLLLAALADDVAEHVQLLVQVRLLLQVSHAHTIGGLGLAVEFGVQARDDLEQRRLAGAVHAHHADLGVGVEAQPDVLEDLLAARPGLGQALHREDVLLRHGIPHRPRDRPGARRLWKGEERRSDSARDGRTEGAPASRRSWPRRDGPRGPRPRDGTQFSGVVVTFRRQGSSGLSWPGSQAALMLSERPPGA